MSKKKVGKKSSEKVEKVKKAEKTEKRSRGIFKNVDHKTWIWVCFAIIALVIVIVAIVRFSQRESYDSSYFHDGEGKIVLTMTAEAAALEDSVYEPNITHIVYYYEGENVTGVKAFYEYATADEARTAFEHLGLSNFADSKSLNGRFVVFQVKKAMYDGLLLSDLKADVEAMKAIDALVLDYEDGYIDNFARLTFEEE